MHGGLGERVRINNVHIRSARGGGGESEHLADRVPIQNNPIYIVTHSTEYLFNRLMSLSFRSLQYVLSLTRYGGYLVQESRRRYR